MDLKYPWLRPDKGSLYKNIWFNRHFKVITRIMADTTLDIAWIENTDQFPVTSHNFWTIYINIYTNTTYEKLVTFLFDKAFPCHLTYQINQIILTSLFTREENKSFEIFKGTSGKSQSQFEAKKISFRIWFGGGTIFKCKKLQLFRKW